MTDDEAVVADMRKQDRNAIKAFAEAGYVFVHPYKFPEEEAPAAPVSKRQAALMEVKKKNAERKSRIEALCDEIEALNIENGRPGAITIARAVAKAHGIGWTEFLSKRRWKVLTRARQHAMWEIYNATTLTLPEIGRVLGGMDHTTILYGIRAHQKRIDSGEVSEAA